MVQIKLAKDWTFSPNGVSVVNGKQGETYTVSRDCARIAEAAGYIAAADKTTAPKPEPITDDSEGYETKDIKPAPRKRKPRKKKTDD